MNPSARALLKEWEDLGDRVVEAVTKEFKPGEIVHWDRRGYRQTGEVISVLGHSARHLRLRVHNRNTNKVVDVHVGDIEEIA